MITDNFLSQDNQIIVTVWVFPFDDDTTARAVTSLFQSEFKELGCWAPDTGAGSTACRGNVRAAKQWQSVAPDHRYVLVAHAMYVNRTSDASIGPWLRAAVTKATYEAGPLNYEGNQ